MTDSAPTSSVKISHLVALTAEGEELGRTTCGVHNMKFFSDSDITSEDLSKNMKLRAKNDRPVFINAVIDGIAVGISWVGFDGTRYELYPFHEGPQKLKIGELLEFPIGGLRVFGCLDKSSFKP